MYFAIFDPYDEKYDAFLYEYNLTNKNEVLDNNSDEDTCCVICWDNNILFEQPQKMQVIKDIKIWCDCNIIVHEKCLYEWIRKTNSCPICRENVVLNNFAIESIRDNLCVFMSDICVKYLRCLALIHMFVWIIYNFILFCQMYYIINQVDT